MSRRVPREALGATGEEDGGDALASLMAAEQATTRAHVSQPPPLQAPATRGFRHTDTSTLPRRQDETNADLCDVGQTQDLPDDFFSLYHTQQQPPSPTEARAVSSAGVPGDLLRHAVLPDVDAADGADGGVRVGRTDCRHAQPSPYVPSSTTDFEEEEAEDGDDSTAGPSAVEDAATTSPPPPSTPPPPPQPRASDAATAATAADAPARPHAFWPHPHPPPPTALPLPRQSRRAFHTQRYGAFIQAYLGLSDVEVEQAQRRGRGICMIGVCKASAPTTASAVPLFSASDARGRAAARLGEPVRVRRTFLRHSVLAVEGDAVFSELIDRAEVLYAVDQQRLDAAAAAAPPGGDAGSSGAAPPTSYANGSGSSSSSSNGGGGAGGGVPASSRHPPPSALFPRFRRLPRVAESYLRPNARCIALHYGLPSKTDPPAAAGATAEDTEGGAPATHEDRHGSNPYPRASLMAVVCTTRLEENEEIHVSLESYYRCLDEAAWYRRCYGALNRRSGCATGGAADNDAAASPAAAVDVVGDVCDGVKRFPAWPSELAYYHGVGRRHASDTAEAAFPFTLVGLAAAPELGAHQKGVVATAWLPYGTCLLYCGPSVATRKVERLVSERALRGDPGKPRPGAEEGSEAAAEADDGDAAAAEDLSFVTDDTYALGLGRHGVCFGQGLTRYINHRYNTSRFGNVELCSVMLSVPSEFASANAPATPTGAGRASGESSRKGGGGTSTAASATAASSPSPSSGIAYTPGPAATFTTAEERAQVARAAAAIMAAKQSRSAQRDRPPPAKRAAVALVGGSGGTRATRDGSAAAASVALSVKTKGRHQRRRARVFFHEDRSFFVTVPFFLVTTDTAPGTPLLAWTYGEEYDAKLERHAVADGHLVPYADAALLNRRLAQPGCSYQRYGGDYRFAVGLGDVVWRRRPVRLPASASALAGRGSSGCLQRGCIVRESDGVSSVYVPPPEEDLFVVVQTGRVGLDRVLLRPLQRVPLTSRQLLGLLREQCLETYVSPHMPAAAVAALPWGAGDEARRHRGGRPPSEKTKRQRAEAAALDFDWAAHWAVLRLTDTSALAPVPSNAGGASAGSPTAPSGGGGGGGVATAAYLTPQALARYEEALRTCVVATLDSLGLLLMDIDYSAVHPRRGTAAAGGACDGVTDMLVGVAASASAAAASKQAGGGSGVAAGAAASGGAAGVAHRHILVNLDDLRHATALVRTSPTRAAAVPALCHGLLWPLISSGASGLGGELPAAVAGSSRRVASRASW